MPFLSIRRRPALEMRRRTQRFPASTQKRRYCRFARNRRLVLLLAWETLFPTIGPLPVTSQTRAMRTLRYFSNSTLLTQGPHLARRVAVTQVPDRKTRHEKPVKSGKALNYNEFLRSRYFARGNAVHPGLP